MTIAIHLARLEVRHAWLLIAAWIAIVAADDAIAEIGPVLAVRQPSIEWAVSWLALLVPSIRLLMACVLVSAVVHTTPLVGSHAFWMTRPIGKWPLLVSKLVVLFALLVVVPAISEAIGLLSRGMPGRLIGLHALEGLFGLRLLAMLVLLVVAALTASPVSFALSLLTSITVVALSITMATMLVFNFLPTSPPDVPKPPIPELAGASQAWLALLAALTLSAAHQFVVRRRGRTIVLTVALVTVALSVRWPIGPERRAATPVPPTWALDERASPIVLTTPDARLIALSDEHLPWMRARSNEGTRAPQFVLAAGLELANVPADYFGEVWVTRSRVTSSNGVTLTGQGGWNMSVAVEHQRRSIGRYNAWERLVGADLAQRRARPSWDRHEQWPVLASEIPSDEPTRFTTDPVTYDGELVVDLWHYTVLSRSALAAANVQTDRGAVEVVHATRSRGHAELLVRRTSLPLGLRPRIVPSFQVVLAHAGREESMSGIQTPAPGTFAFGFSRMAQFVSFGVHGGSAEEAGWARYRFPADDGTADDERWLDEAQIAVVEIRYAGRIARRLHVDRLHVELGEPLSMVMQAGTP